MEKPEGIIITVSQSMIGVNGYRQWLHNFLHAMRQDEWIYSFRAATKPKQDVLYVYLCIGNRIRYRALYVRSTGACLKHFSDGRTLEGKAWVEVCGPVVRAPKAIHMTGFQGFRYTPMLF